MTAFFIKKGEKISLYYLYMLRCEDGSIYTGIAKDYKKRFKEHLDGKGAKYTKSHKPIKIERVFECEDRSIACSLEIELKTFDKNKKEKIIEDPNIFIKEIENKRKIKIIKKL